MSTPAFTPPANMSLEDQVTYLMQHLALLQAQPTPAPAPVPVLPPNQKPPKVAAPTPYSGSQDDLDRFKAECGVYLHV